MCVAVICWKWVAVKMIKTTNRIYAGFQILKGCANVVWKDIHYTCFVFKVTVNITSTLIWEFISIFVIFFLWLIKEKNYTLKVILSDTKLNRNNCTYETLSPLYMSIYAANVFVFVCVTERLAAFILCLWSLILFTVINSKS